MSLKLHHLNCATICPFGARLINGRGGSFSRALMVCHCLLIETNEGLILIDAGLGLDDISNPKRLGRMFLKLMQPRLKPEECAINQLVKLGFRRDDVRHIVLTHLDVDHAGGISDFPNAQIHVSEEEYKAAMNPQTIFEKHRYITAQWKHRPLWVRHSLQGEQWFGFERVQVIKNSFSEILLIPLHGHTRGHCGVAVSTTNGWILHCGDAYFYYGEIDVANPHCTPMLNIFQRIVEVNHDERLYNQIRLRELVKENNERVQVFCSHDNIEFSRFNCYERKT